MEMATSPELVYLDHAATTPVDPRVLEAMLPYMTEKFGNPSSIYSVGREAAAALRQAREQVAEVLNCKPEEVYFTSGVPNRTTPPSGESPWPRRSGGRPPTSSPPSSSTMPCCIPASGWRSTTASR